MARLDAGAQAFVPEDVLVAEQIDAAWRPHAAEAAARGITLERDVPADLVHLTDELALRRILANLLENAVHHGDAGQPVHVAAHLDGTTLDLEVSSSARDADPDVVRHCFEAFWRSDPSRTGTGTHAGLGLALCRKLAEGLGGSIEAELADGRFVVSVALPDADAPTA
jgi:signal transduction histidine kinase